MVVWARRVAVGEVARFWICLEGRAQPIGLADRPDVRSERWSQGGLHRAGCEHVRMCLSATHWILPEMCRINISQRRTQKLRGQVPGLTPHPYSVAEETLTETSGPGPEAAPLPYSPVLFCSLIIVSQRNPWSVIWELEVWRDCHSLAGTARTCVKEEISDSLTARPPPPFFSL